jgi:hypothetical protein
MTQAFALKQRIGYSLDRSSQLFRRRPAAEVTIFLATGAAPGWILRAWHFHTPAATKYQTRLRKIQPKNEF